MKSTANAKLLQSFSAGEAIRYVLRLPIHRLAVGCTTIGQLEDDIPIAQQFQPYTKQELAGLRARAGIPEAPLLTAATSRASNPSA